MKIPAAILLLSLAANLALGIAWLRRAAPGPVTAPAATSVPGQASAKAAVAATPTAPGPQTWTHLNAADDQEFIARLRAEGFPPNLLAGLAYARLLQRHAAEFRKFQPSADYEYWRRGRFQFDNLSPEERAARRTLGRRIGDEIRELLGPDADTASGYQRANRERLYGNLPMETVDQLAAIDRDYSELAAMVRDRSQGVTLPEDREHLAALEREKRADLARLLSPGELLEYDLRSSPSASRVRSQLRYFEPTEEEYRALAALQIGFDNTYGGTNPSGAQQTQRREAAAELAAQIKALLPPERFAEYEIKTDPAYPMIARTIAQYNPSADPIAVMTAQRDLAQRYNAIRNNRDLAAAARNAQLDALAAEANTRMAAALGPEAFKIFKTNGGPINSLLNRQPRNP